MLAARSGGYRFVSFLLKLACLQDLLICSVYFFGVSCGQDWLQVDLVVLGRRCLGLLVFEDTAY